MAKTISPKQIIIIVVIVFIVFVLFSSFYTVEKDQKAVVTQFGKYEKTESPGLHFKLPFGIENVQKVTVERVLKEEFGFKTTSVYDSKSEFYRGDVEVEEAQMLTADLKVIQIEWIVQYKVSDPKNYLFKVKDPRNTLRIFSKIVMSQVAGDYFFDEIITIAKNEITNKVYDNLQARLNELEMGIAITTVALINVIPPTEVEAAYNEVLQSQQEKDKIVNEAKTEYIKRVTPAEGEASKMIAEAKGYYAERIKVAQGEANYFTSLYKEYVKAPDITKTRMYLETISEVLPRFEHVYIIDDKQKNLLPFLPLNTPTLSKGGKND
ncbi:MAG: HflK protein [Spirochaetes bacterium GWD1_27_9]|nr:MAG: HflK protein [Spirochaetes bacterium GWB1_27_13]OHD23595.1 MAG: HflK protein [Spirochaetes bacterium GWC1_27_15]OHD39517.1 MAG: HflK protein [Spirochaetes bacterium GWD1_27_9]